MLTLNNNYQFRYPKNNIKYVYYPQKTYRTFYSIPFNKKDNVLLFYAEKEYINSQYKVEKISIEDASYIGNIFKMPIVVVLNSYCDIQNKNEIYDIYYLYKDNKHHVTNQ